MSRLILLFFLVASIQKNAGAGISSPTGIHGDKPSIQEGINYSFILSGDFLARESLVYCFDA
jgi:hypothetical protein